MIYKSLIFNRELLENNRKEHLAQMKDNLGLIKC